MTGKNAKALFDTFALSPSFAHHLQNVIWSQSNPFHPWINLCSLSQMKLLIHKPLSLIIKTRIRGLDAFSLPSGAACCRRPPSMRWERSWAQRLNQGQTWPPWWGTWTAQQGQQSGQIGAWSLIPNCYGACWALPTAGKREGISF